MSKTLKYYNRNKRKERKKWAQEVRSAAINTGISFGYKVSDVRKRTEIGKER